MKPEEIKKDMKVRLNKKFLEYKPTYGPLQEYLEKITREFKNNDYIVYIYEIDDNPDDTGDYQVFFCNGLNGAVRDMWINENGDYWWAGTNNIDYYDSTLKDIPVFLSLEEQPMDNDLYCNCSNPQIVPNSCNGENFLFCRNCKKEKNK